MGRIRWLALGLVLVIFAAVVIALMRQIASRHPRVARYYFHLKPQPGYEHDEWAEAVVEASERHSEPENPVDGPHEIIRYNIYEYKGTDARPPVTVFLSIDVGPNFSSKTEEDGAEEALKEYIRFAHHATILSRSRTP